MRMRIYVLPVPAMVLLAALMAGPLVLAQSGSTGGAIGKQGKSASGGDDQPAPRPAPPRQRVRAPADDSDAEPRSAARSDGNCGRIAGTWAWFNSVDVVINAGGTMQSSNGYRGTWSCEDGMYTLVWQPLGNQDKLMLSSSGKRLSGSGMFGIAVSGTRK